MKKLDQYIIISIALITPISWGLYEVKKIKQKESRCIIQLRIMHQSVASYHGINGIVPGQSYDHNDVIKEFGLHSYVCPSGGVYTWSKTLPHRHDPAVRCSHKGHVFTP